MSAVLKAVLIRYRVKVCEVQEYHPAFITWTERLKGSQSADWLWLSVEILRSIYQAPVPFQRSVLLRVYR